MLLRRAIVSGALLLLLVGTACADDADTAGEVLKLADTRQGLCVHLGAGSKASPALTAELAAGSRMLVHGLALDDVSLIRARRAIEARKVFGRASVEKVALPPLPYLRDLARVVVIEDWAALKKRGLTMDEVLRVTAPGGTVCEFKDGKWTKSWKLWPKEMDDWRHPSHDPGRTWTSNDEVIRYPVGLRWADGLPNNLTGFSDCKAYVVANGRLFTLGINQLENMGQRRGPKGYDQYLCARDAWSGLPLWKVNCKNVRDGRDITWLNAGPLVAADASVYSVCEEKKVIRADAATGRILWTRETKFPIYRMVLLDGVLVTGTWGETESIWFKTQPKAGPGSVEAFDAETGKPVWKLDETAWTLLAGDGTVYLQPQGGGKPRVLAVDVRTGAERWRVEHTEGETPALRLNVAGPGFVALTRVLDKKKATLAVHDPKTGRELWHTPSRPGVAWTPLVKELLWVGGMKLDPLTGKDHGKIGHWIGGQGCSPKTIVWPYMVVGRSASALELPSSPAEKAQSLIYRGARGACVQGMVPANGMLYTAQNMCKCLPSHVYGFLAVGPTTDPTEEDFAAARTVEKGAGFGSPLAAADGQGWPTLRADAERSASTTSTLPTTLRKQWSVQVVSDLNGPLAPAWKPQLLSPLSAPTVSNGLVVVAATDEGRILAVDAADGKTRWTVTLGSRVDGPPTIHRGLCIVGCHDGYVYALRATDGVLAWRVRVAPAERRMVAWGRVESVWPVTGSVLVHDGVAYATAGRSTESDGGIAVLALDVATGETRWARSIGAGVLRLNDIFALRNGQLGWRYLTLDKSSGKILKPETMDDIKSYGGGKGNLEGGIMDGTYTMSTNRRAGGAFNLGDKRANQLAWNATWAVSESGAFTPDGKTQRWRPPSRGTVFALALTKNLAVYACRSSRRYSPNSTSSLHLVDLADGKRVGAVPLASVPTYDGLAIADGRVYVSLRNGTLLCFGNAD